MSDLVERLREFGRHPMDRPGATSVGCAQAADEIERLTAERDEAWNTAEQFRQSMYALEERVLALSRAEAENARLKAALEQVAAGGRAALQVKVATAIQNCQLHSEDPDADESYFDGKERAYRNVLAWLREAEQRPLVRPRG
jgi:hypothetical protein